MTRHAARTVLVLFSIALLISAGTAAGASREQVTNGGSALMVDPASRAKRLPTFESLVPMPPILDPSLHTSVTIVCKVSAIGNRGGVNGVRGRYSSQVIVRDNSDGTLQAVDVAAGTFRTVLEGLVLFEFVVDSQIFADGFESGDVSAWAYTRSRFTNGKKIRFGEVSCATVVERG